MHWKNHPTLVTGGASFIGSHLVDALVARGACVRIVDDLSSGTMENIRSHIENGSVEFHKADLLDARVAVHGGRGFVDLHELECSKNFILDGNVFHAAAQEEVENFVYASSGCVYP